MAIVLYHNPSCSKSRRALELLEQAGVELQVVEYLKSPPTPEELRRIIALGGLAVRDLLREGEAEYDELGLGDPSAGDDSLIEAIAAHPRILQRPLVVAGDRALVARPPERVRELL